MRSGSSQAVGYGRPGLRLDEKCRLARIDVGWLDVPVRAMDREVCEHQFDHPAGGKGGKPRLVLGPIHSFNVLIGLWAGFGCTHGPTGRPANTKAPVGPQQAGNAVRANECAGCDCGYGLDG